MFAPTPEPNSEVRLSGFGYLRLALGESGYDFAFVSPDGTVLDQGSGTCHAPPPPPPESTTTTVAPRRRPPRHRRRSVAVPSVGGRRFGPQSISAW